jgi:hypothetical protein
VTRLNKILAGVLAVQLVLVVFMLLRGDAGRIGKLEPLVSIDADKVERIRVFEAPGDKEKKRADGPAVELVKRGSEWALTSHFDYPVDKAKVTELLDKVAGIRTRGPVASGKSRQKQLEVADEAYQRKLVLTAGGVDTTIYVGASAGARQTSVRLAGSDQIHGASGLSAFAIGASPASWIDTAFFKVEKGQIAGIDLVNQNGNFTLEPAADAPWKVEVNGQPLAPPAGSEIDSDMADRIASRVSSIMMNEPGDPKRTIDKPLYTVTVRMKAPEPAQPAGADPATPPPMSEPGQEYVIDFAQADEDKTYVRVRGSSQAALVSSASIADLAELSRDKLVRKIGEKPAAGEGAPEMPQGLPPGIDLEQLQQQLQQQQGQ